MFNSFTSCFSISHSHYITCYIMYFSFLLHNLLGRVTYLFSYAKRHNHAGGLWAITNDVLKFRKIIEFQSSWIAMSCQWIVYSYTKNAKSAWFVSFYSPYTPVNSLKKIILLQSLGPKWNTCDKKNTQTQATR